MKVRTKLLITFSVIIALLWAIGFYTWSIFGNLNEQFSTVEEDIIPDAIAMTEVEKLSNEIYREVTEYLYHDMEDAKDTALTRLERLEEIGFEYLPIQAFPGITAHGKDCILAGKIYDFYFSTTWLINLKERGAGYNQLLARDRSMSLPALLEMQERAGQLKAASIGSLALTRTTFNRAYSDGLRSIFISAGVVTLIVLVAAVLTTRSILNPLHALHKGTEVIARGNLNYKVNTEAKDEIGELSRAFDQMTQSLSTSMTSIDDLNREINERKLAEEKLRESEKFTSSLMENAPHATMVVDPDTSIRYVNPAWVELNGWTSSEIVGTKAPYPWWPDEFKEEFHSTFKEAMKQGNGSGEIFAQKKNGEIYWINMNWATVTHNGEVQYLLINSVDITEHKRADEALKESEEKFSKAFNASPEVITISKLKDGTILEVNDTFTQSTGFTREEVIGRSGPDIGIWVDKRDRDVIISKLKKNDNVRNQEYKFRSKSGKLLTSLLSAEIINLGNEPCLLIATNDITERKQAEEALAESEAKFSAAFRSSPDVMTISKMKDGKYIEVNDSFVHFTGYSRKELIGHNLEELNMWVDQKERKRMEQLLTQKGKIRHEELRFRMKSGEICTWLCSADIINIGGDPCMLSVATDITKRKQAEEALRESEERFSKAFRASPGSMSISRLKDGKFIEVNESFLRDKGFTREEVIGQTSVELGIWRDQNHRERILTMLQEQGRVHNEPTTYRTKSGELRTGYTSAEYISLGNEPCVIFLTTDETELKQAEEQLRLLSTVTQQVSDSIVIINADFKITYMNQAAQGLFGYTLEEAKGNFLGLFDAKPPSEKEKEHIRNLVTSGKVYSSIATKKRKDGSLLICDCRLSSLYDEEGKLFAYLDVQRDITEKKEVEAKLQEQKKLIERILATMPEGVLVIDGTDRILLANEAFCDIFHTGKKAIANKPLDEIIPVTQLLKLYKAVKRRDKANTTLEFRFQVKDIEKRIVCVITRMNGGRTLLTFSDVSQEREEEEKLYLTDRLASIGEMAAGLAHELNNPLTGVLALSQLLISSDIPEEHKEDLECVYNEAKRAANIVKNVLLFTRNNNYENGHASANEVIRDVLRLREYEETVSNISAFTKLQEDLPDISIDKFQLQQVFLNIILNAEAAMKEANRPGILKVSTERVNNHINIHFKDNGCGMKKHILPRIFDPFFTTKEIGKGTGLGLSICYGIVMKHGGKISLKTRPNKGTTFTIRMPALLQET